MKSKQPKTLQDKIKDLPPERQQVIALRHDQLVADELARQEVHIKDLNAFYEIYDEYREVFENLAKN
ncbi:hypothetical protein 2AV2_82 [Nodularia phage vB_NpeS-2AV2]|jgi:hypothetical protein|uniref:Uncharacterized protein n=3 Tax=Ravarandavirus TaxID=2843444 RepID=A0A482MLK0_9CAUD|nr:hypothetical protein HWA92_gp082 [Nodularia phage vB_NpeS-2AV2]YP_009844906.1 hypothetical protein HWC13_gp097 [Nodularia phage vB_NspS-kac68v161]ALY07534.1 hypothetical protein 2AV2_82 [Nodularia phage vB_NpeS-2AV2]QBQ73747.1 hypothetical protein kac68v161_gp097 [Nodularia phage vB_NspS-kac68v161]QBQ73943.1 hypothetical protein kac68v162_gp095 [Nodularia phage vB_NspS-kac68v162]